MSFLAGRLRRPLDEAPYRVDGKDAKEKGSAVWPASPEAKEMPNAGVIDEAYDSERVWASRR